MRQEFLKLFKCFILCVCLCLIIAIVVATLLRTPLLTEGNVYLYRLLVLTGTCCIVLVVICFFAYRKKMSLFNVSFSISILCIGLSTLFMMLFFVLGPMTIERSYTIYSLVDMADHSGQVYSADEIKDQFIEGYIGGQ